MKQVYLTADNIYSPLGKTSRENISALKSGRSGIRLHEDMVTGKNFYASLLMQEDKMGTGSLTPFEQIIVASVTETLNSAPVAIDLTHPRTGFILSSTKGNVSLIETDAESPAGLIGLPGSAARIAAALGITASPVVVSHACISGLLAMITAMRFIQSGRFDQVIVTGADLITEFIFSGFQSFHAVSDKPCRPFDADRDGISLGEGAATIILSATAAEGSVRLSGGSVSNDANHISGPSRTGAELFSAIHRAMDQAQASAGEIDFISAHGTATRYNDDMEAKAIGLAGMEETPVNSLKGYYGHTLGAAGLIESVISAWSLREEIVFPTPGFERPGTEKPVNVVKEMLKMPLRKCLKTASGFGGCNAAIVLESVDA